MPFGGPPPIFSFMFTLVLFIIIGVTLVIAGRSLFTWMSNNASEKITANARIVSKRTRVSGGGGDSSAHTSYYVTFEFENGARQEFHIRGSEFGMMAEGDRGRLTYQGTRLITFDRV